MAIITEKLEVLIQEATCDNPIYLRWESRGGYNPFDTRPRAGTGYWLFDYNQEFGLSIDNGEEVAANFTELENQTYVTTTLKKMGKHIATLTTVCEELDHVLGLETLALSHHVEYLVDQAANTWQKVKVVPGSFSSYETKSKYWEISLQIEFEMIVIPSN